jgi:hypothetical protein
MTRLPRPGRLAAALLALLALACDRAGPLPSEGPTLPGDPAALTTAARAPFPAPGGTVTVPVAGGAVAFWPYTGESFDGRPQDPVNLILTGRADPRSVRAALLRLDGNRTALGFPPVAPFDCTWSDAIGGLQTAWSGEDGWLGSAIQLQCGAYGPVRFHVRLFGAGSHTLANAHFEVLIPGTTSHQVLSWELAEQLVTADLVRTGLLAGPPAPTAPIHASPFRTIPDYVYNGLPAALRQLIGGPAGPISGSTPILTDGRATVIALAGEAAAPAGGTRAAFVVPFDQVIPKPFCVNGPSPYVHVSGPVRLVQDVEVTPTGEVRSRFRAEGRLAVTPVDPTTGPPTPLAPTYAAEVMETQDAVTGDAGGTVSGRQQQLETPFDSPARGQLRVTLVVGRNGRLAWDRTVRCGPGTP